MATTVRVPIDLRNPRVSSLAGNAFWSVLGLTAWDAGHWEYAKDVDGKIYGVVTIPKNVAGTPAAKLVLAIAANATSGVTRLGAATKSVADGASLNPGSLTAETSQDITVPGVAYQRKDVTFPTGGGSLAESVAADSLLVVELTHEGSHANDTLAVGTLLVATWLQVDLT